MHMLAKANITLSAPYTIHSHISSRGGPGSLEERWALIKLVVREICLGQSMAFYIVNRNWIADLK
jgi:hypothetical protein